MTRRKTPLRKCVVTNERKPKEELLRVVRNKEGEVFIDPTGRKNGRGAYVSNDLAVIEKASEIHALNQAFRMEIDPSIYEELKQYILSERKKS